MTTCRSLKGTEEEECKMHPSGSPSPSPPGPHQMEQGDQLLAWKEQPASRPDEVPSPFGPSLSALS